MFQAVLVLLSPAYRPCWQCPGVCFMAITMLNVWLFRRQISALKALPVSRRCCGRGFCCSTGGEQRGTLTKSIASTRFFFFS